MSDIVDKIVALLAHAEDSFRHGRMGEADLYQAKALKLMADHAIDQAMLASTKPSHRTVETVTIPGQDLPATYQTAHANGMARLATLLGGYAYWNHPWHSTKVNNLYVAIDGVEAFRHLVLGLASIAGLHVSVVAGDRSYRVNWVTGFWHGVCEEASTQVTRDSTVSQALVAVSGSAKATLLTGVSTPKPYRLPVRDFSGLTDGHVNGVEAYRSFGKTVGA